jgi:hypothetical protein
MKKFFILAIVLVQFALTSWAGFNPVNNIVLQSFNRDFGKVTNVEWTTAEQFVRAKFEVDSQIMFAYYTENGQLMAVTRNIRTNQLPVRLAKHLKSDYRDYCLAELFEVSKEGESRYYASLRRGNCSVILESHSTGEWHVYKKQKL